MMRTAILLVVFFGLACPAPARETEGRQSDVHYVTCDIVRAYVARVGITRARALAMAHGMTASQERAARRCLSGEADQYGE